MGPIIIAVSIAIDIAVMSVSAPIASPSAAPQSAPCAIAKTSVEILSLEIRVPETPHRDPDIAEAKIAYIIKLNVLSPSLFSPLPYRSLYLYSLAREEHALPIV